MRLNALSDSFLYVGQQLQLKAEAPAAAPSTVQYTVQPGDYLQKIADGFGVTLAALRAANNLQDDFIWVGQVLKVPVSNIHQPEQARPQPTTPEPSRPTPGTTAGIPAHYSAAAKEIARQRQLFTLVATNGEAFFEVPLQRGLVQNAQLISTDVQKVQARLVQLNLLSQNHNEAPGNERLRLNNLPQTVKALQRFQERYKASFWSAAARLRLVNALPYRVGQVVPGDVTELLLKSHTHYLLSFPHPTANGSISASFSNFVASTHTRYPWGVYLRGDAAPELPLSLFTDLGLSPSLAEAVKFISAHEGNYDAINTYDKAIVSFGFIQFAGNGGGLGAVLGTMKRRFPAVFEQYFIKFGIDVRYQLRNNEVHKGQLRVADLRSGNVRWVEGIPAEHVINQQVLLVAPFIRSAYNLQLLSCQVEHAVKGYVEPALGIRLNINTGRFRAELPITEVILTPKGMAMAIDLTINQWINKTRSLFEQAVNSVARRQNLHSAQALRSLNEESVLRQIIALANGDQRIIQRGSNILNSNLSLRKGDAVV
jgi:peptidoglycan endopeptidase LytF